MTSSMAAGRGRARGSPDVEFYTPPWLMERIAAFLGPDFYDPCPARYGAPLAENGLAVSWARRRVYCNPPYGQAIRPWIAKAATEPTQELLLLVPAATDATWFVPLFSYSVCFIAGRLRFVRPDGRVVRRDRTGQDLAVGGTVEHASHASVLAYRGRRRKQFAEAFADLGTMMRQYQPRKSKQPHLLSA